jgi:hypothetical protein
VTLVVAVHLAVRLAQPELDPPAPPPVERSDALTYSLVAEQHLPPFARGSAVCRAVPVGQLVPAGWPDVAAADLGLIGCAGSSDSPACRPLYPLLLLVYSRVHPRNQCVPRCADTGARCGRFEPTLKHSYGSFASDRRPTGQTEYGLVSRISVYQLDGEAAIDYCARVSFAPTVAVIATHCAAACCCCCHNQNKLPRTSHDDFRFRGRWLAAANSIMRVMTNRQPGVG